MSKHQYTLSMRTKTDEVRYISGNLTKKQVVERVERSLNASVTEAKWPVRTGDYLRIEMTPGRKP